MQLYNNALIVTVTAEPAEVLFAPPADAGDEEAPDADGTAPAPPDSAAVGPPAVVYTFYRMVD